jgi:O-antigen/teichoic acid export membrane protein
MAANLGTRIAAGAAWMVVFKLLDRSIGIVSVVILARLLVPADFGLVAMGTAITAIIELLSAFSFDMALIQSQHATRAHYDTAWTLNVAMAAACALLVAAAAFPAGDFYGDPRLGPIMLWLSLATLIRGFENVGVVAFRKELKLNREFQLLLTKRIGVFLATISIALATRSYWALVLGTLAGSVGGVVLSYLFHPFRPRFALSARSELFHFSMWMVFSNVINTLASRAADLVIGKSLGPGPLGLFNLAHEISHLPSTELSAPVNRAVYPGYAKVASDPARLTAQFLEVLGLTALLTAPVALGIAAVAPLLVPLLLGGAWIEAVPLMKILALAGLLASLRTNAGYVFLALGKSELLTVMTAVRFAVGVPALVFGTVYFGTKGAAWTILGTAIVMLPVTHGFMHRVLRIHWAQHGSVLWRPAVAAAGMYLLVREYLAWTEDGFAASNAVLALASAVGLGIAIYVSFTGLLWAVSGFPQSAEARVVTALHGFLGRLQGKAG